MRNFLREPNPGDPISANLIREIIRAIRSLTPIKGHGIKISQGPNGTVYSTKVKNSDGNEILPWTFSCTDKDGERTGGWRNCRMQIGFNACFDDEDGDNLDLCSDGIHYAEVDLESEHWELKCEECEPGIDIHVAAKRLPPHKFGENKVNVFIGVVEDGKCVYSIHCIPVVYKYV